MKDDDLEKNVEENLVDTHKCRKLKKCKEKCNNNEHKIMLFKENKGENFHVLREESDGTWSTKIGFGPVMTGITDTEKHLKNVYKWKSKKAVCYCCPKPCAKEESENE